MHVYLRHPVHGTKVAISDFEVEADERNGWVRYEPVSDPAATPAPPEANVLEIKRRRRVPAPAEV